jgi:hypothetical protein
MCTGNADRAGLVGDRTGDRLPDPPGRIGRELVAAAIFELIDGLHQADIAFLDQVQELQAAVRVLLGDRDHEAKVGFDHLLLGLAGFALALLHHVHDLAEFADLETGLGGELLDFAAQFADAVLPMATKSFQPRPPDWRRDAASSDRARSPDIAQEVLARDAVAVGQAQQAAFGTDEALVDVVELLDERIDAVAG